jgi:DNA-directed RNA polymerase specialized sigma24 family protein
MSKMADLAYDIETLFIDGDSPQAIAEQLGIPLSMVKSTLQSFGVDVRDLEEEVYSPYNGA